MPSDSIPISRRSARQPKPNIPQTLAERNRVLKTVRNYVAEFNPVPPLPLQQIKAHAAHIAEMLGCESIFHDYIGVLLNNELWRETVATVPYERRLLLLPKCLRAERKCAASLDEFGLLCKECGCCSIQDLQSEAVRLGYAVLVAEGSAVVMSLIQTGKIDAIIGVSCLNVLERAFPNMESAAIPGVAIPLLQDDCANTSVDLSWVLDYIHLSNDDQTRRLDLGALRKEVDSWFEPAVLDRIMGIAKGETEKIARGWLARTGKRWRPFLAVAAYQALRSDPGAPLPESLKQIAVAVECFHKASLVHDDIEDNDSLRYGEITLHEKYNVPVALNVGDLLIGEGYRLIASTGISSGQTSAMLRVAAEGQRQLCRGQGSELCWMRSPKPLTSLEVLDIFRRKTAPAFEVALRLGALHAGVAEHDAVSTSLTTYSESLGVAYQIRDDLIDFTAGDDSGDIAGMRPGLLLAIAHERAVTDQEKQLTQSLWHRQTPPGTTPELIGKVYADLGVNAHATMLLESFKETAIRSLDELESPNLKGLLRRIIARIFDETEIRGWCREFANQR